MNDQQAVLATNAAFYAAFEALSADAMAAVWANGAGDVCIHPGWDILVGGEMVQESWALIFGNTGYLRFEPSDVRVVLDGDMATVTCIENIFSVIEGHTIHGRLACTNVFRRNSEHDSVWRMVIHHASPIAQAQTVIPVSESSDELH
jgi:ketosteroid isomerase-like protein